ncbi:MAG: hypothetical protein DIU78_018920 [Pseudomonadota bacterium]|nr:MAG: hypothetical protein DIU78_07785 [Pseudomonadota bacterium]
MNRKRIRVRKVALRSLVLVTAMAGALLRCGAEVEGTVETGDDEIIAGFPANGHKLDAIGTIGIAWVDSWD